MKMQTKRNFLITGVLFLLFITFTLATKIVDVQAIGPQNSVVGFATLNAYVFEYFGVHLLWYHITDWLGVVAILIAFIFATLGLVQWITRKKLRKVDFRILLLGAYYLIVIAFYLFFECHIVNYRPILLGEHLEASYPSSHTMIVLCIMGTATTLFKQYFKDKKSIATLLSIFSWCVITITVIGRLISGVHWFTDIVGGVLLSIALISLYHSFVEWIGSKEKK